jgi:hypothetical protein
MSSTERLEETQTSDKLILCTGPCGKYYSPKHFRMRKRASGRSVPRGAQHCKRCRDAKNRREVRSLAAKNPVVRNGLNPDLLDFLVDNHKISPKHIKEARQQRNKKQRERNRELYTNLNSRLANMLSGARRRAKTNNLKFNLTREYLRQLWDENDGCSALSGIAFDLSRDPNGGNTNPLGPSIDRIDNTDYVQGKVQLLTNWENKAKSNHSQEYFITMCGFVVDQNSDDPEKEEDLKDGT